MVLFGRATQPLDLWLGAGVSLLLGLLSWYVVENKLTAQINRLSGSLKQAGVLFVGILAVCGVARLVETEKIAAPNTEWQSLEQNILLEAGHPVETEECVNQGKYCYIGDKAMPPSVIFVGDSHATSMYAGLSMLASKYHRSALLVANSSCPTITGLKPLNKDDSIQSCPKSNQLFLETLQRYPNAKVVILNRYNAYIVGSTLGGQWRPFYYLGDKPDENDPVSVEKLKSDLAQGMLSTAC